MLGVHAQFVREGVVRSGALALGDVAARVDHKPVEPRGELRFAPELAQAHAEFRQCLLGGIARVFRVTQDVPCEPLPEAHA